jgi:hypothetical protein
VGTCSLSALATPHLRRPKCQRTGSSVSGGEEFATALLGGDRGKHHRRTVHCNPKSLTNCRQAPLYASGVSRPLRKQSARNRNFPAATFTTSGVPICGRNFGGGASRPFNSTGGWTAIFFADDAAATWRGYAPGLGAAGATFRLESACGKRSSEHSVATGLYHSHRSLSSSPIVFPTLADLLHD